jgi:transposase
MIMAKPLLPERLWLLIEPLLPPHPPHPLGGRPFIEDRKVLTALIFVLRTGIPWEYVPMEMGCGCGMTAWRRLRDWMKAGMWLRIHSLLLEFLRFNKQIDFQRFLSDSMHVRAVGGGTQTGPSPVDRSKLGSKIHLLTDAGGVPIQASVSGGNVPDVQVALPLLDAVQPIAGAVGAPRKRPTAFQADTAYDAQQLRVELRRRGIRPVIGHRRRTHGSHLGKTRWFIERTLSWLKQFRRLRVRYDRDVNQYLAFLLLTMALICYRLYYQGL